MAMALSLFSLAASAQAQEEEVSPEAVQVDIESRMMEYAEEFNQLAATCDMQIRFSDAIPLSVPYVQVLNDKVIKLNESLQAINQRWSLFIQAMQMDIADNDELMSMMSNVQQIEQSVADSIASKKQQCDALTDFTKAEQFIIAQDTVYNSLYKKAFELSLMKKLQAQLEKLKAQEQTLFNEIQEHYNKARQACELIPMLKKRMGVIDDHYANVQVISKKIQEMAYKPFFQRIKDYLISLACVTILLLVVNLIVSKYKVMKTTRKQMKQYQDMMRQNNGAGDNYPTI